MYVQAIETMKYVTSKLYIFQAEFQAIIFISRIYFNTESV